MGAGFLELQLGVKTANGDTDTESVFLGGGFPMSHSVHCIVTGAPAAANVRLYGSLDGTNWFDLTGAQVATSSILFHVVNRPVAYVKANLADLSGGTSPTFTFRYLGIKN